MMQVIQKWKVVIRYNDKLPVVVGVADNFYSNVLQHLAKMDFGNSVSSLEISRCNSIEDNAIDLTTTPNASTGKWLGTKEEQGKK